MMHKEKPRGIEPFPHTERLFEEMKRREYVVTDQSSVYAIFKKKPPSRLRSWMSRVFPKRA